MCLHLRVRTCRDRPNLGTDRQQHGRLLLHRGEVIFFRKELFARVLQLFDLARGHLSAEGGDDGDDQRTPRSGGADQCLGQHKVAHQDGDAIVEDCVYGGLSTALTRIVHHIVVDQRGHV